MSAASSLSAAFAKIGTGFAPAKVNFQFAGSNLLARQIESGARPGVFASANAVYITQLREQGLVEAPVQFATNRLVVAVRADAESLDSFSDLEAPDVKIAAGSEAVPVGMYARELLAKLPKPQRSAIARNIKSAEPGADAVVGKVAAGAVDAGFVYATDVEAANGKLKALEIPGARERPAAYWAAVVKGAQGTAAAREFVAQLRQQAAQQIFTSAGFGPAPR